ncbi:TPA_asm: hypothetical protein [ssRNA phage Gerhypos.4_67]|uniref:Uncharacterized protein n=2 Tax=Fiersviridae TaxID=2842319 RepID=A0A8S5L1U5_9VIRU|nr:hypothetical protein QIJ86_gp1 [ssRNA phage Gerhypos.4_67]QDH90401.1 MAG: hypothetical protein H4Bulk48492_000004 [Leviviridae sp.]DAD51451.1 TPA_asm: hypothetical protein [ssRNA phage Gerhypos.4_67]
MANGFRTSLILDVLQSLISFFRRSPGLTNRGEVENLSSSDRSKPSSEVVSVPVARPDPSGSRRGQTSRAAEGGNQEFP